MIQKLALKWLGLMTLFFMVNLSAKFTFMNQYSTINVLNTNSQLILNTPLTGFSGTLNLKDNATSTISGSSAANTVTFANGVLNTGLVSSVLKGTFDPTGTDAITLGNGDFMDVKSGTVVQAVTVLSASTATIVGQPKFASSITLTSASSILQLGITTELTQTISGAGTLSLLDDLSIGQNVQLPSIVTQNGKKLSFSGGGTQSVALTNTGGGTIEFHGYTALTALWTIGSGSDVYNINGNGAVLDLSSSGGITFNGTTLYINNLTIRGLQSANSLKGTGRIVMSNVTLELAGALTRSDGSYTFYGDVCKVVTNGSTFTISGSGNEILVNGIVLLYDQLDGTGSSPFATASSGQINFSNGGKIQSAAGGSNNLLITTTSYTFANNFDLTSSSNIQVQNTNTSVSKSVSASGAGHCIRFPHTSGSFFNLDGNVQLTLSNIVLKDFNPAAISFGTSSSLTFGDGVRLELGPWLTMASGDKAWTFNGNAEIDAGGGLLRINKSQGITITGSKTLTIKNARIEVTTIDAIKALSDTSVVALQNVTLVLQSAGFSFGQGSMTIAGNVTITGGAITTTPTTTFELATKGSLTIGENAVLTIDPNVNFSYNIDGSTDANSAAQKRHIIMSYVGSTINLNGCTVLTSTNGIALDQGTLKIKDMVTISTLTGTNASFELGPLLTTQLLAGANLNINGIATYSESVPLRYGDGIVLQHANYGFYLGVDTSYVYPDTHYLGVPSPTIGLSTITNKTKWYVEAGDSMMQYGNPSKVGTTVKSGDPIRLENYNYSGFIIRVGGMQILVSTDANISGNTVLTGCQNQGLIMYRIFKYGGSVGDTIYQTDSVYLVNYRGEDLTNPGSSYPDKGAYYYLGSSNGDLNAASSLLKIPGAREIFAYQTYSTTKPANFTNTYLWTINTLYSAAYQTAPVWYYGSAGILFNGYIDQSAYPDSYPTAMRFSLNSWPAASLTQF